MTEQASDATTQPLDRGQRFMRLLLANQQRIYGLLLALVGDWNDADDVMQETTAVMWAKFDTFEPGTDFAAWGLRIARYQAMHFLKVRGNTRRRFSEQTLDMIAETVMEVGEELDDRRDALRHCMQKLMERDRKLVQLRYEPGMTTRSLADRVGRSIDATYKALNRAHSQLLACIRRTMAEGRT